MPQIVWTDEGLGSLKRIYHFVDQYDSPAAKRTVQAIHREVSILSNSPTIGRVVRGAMRELVVRSGPNGYVVQYALDSGKVLILAVRHQRQAAY